MTMYTHPAIVRAIKGKFQWKINILILYILILILDILILDRVVNLYFIK
jgi:hypothetical protein